MTWPRPRAPGRIDGEFRYRHAIEVRYGDTDALGHVNNAVYLSYFEAARGGYYTSVVGRTLRERVRTPRAAPSSSPRRRSRTARRPASASR